ncbi:MAG: WG repeat-containing protein [Bacteroidales bacterium]|nr:WG repeat-containing protein [Bacteroidales bacterium]
MIRQITILLVALLSLSFAKGQEVYPMYYPCQAEETGEWGYVDKDGEWAITPMYGPLRYETNGGMYPVSRAGKWGFVGVSGEPLTDIVYDGVAYEIDYQKYKYPATYAAIRLKGKWAFINVQGIKVTDFKYDEVLIYNGKYVIRIKDKNGHIKSGYLLKDGVEVWD